MKKFLVCIILLMIPFMCFSKTVYKVDTAFGEKTVVVPDGATCEDVMLVLAKNYYEISYEYDSVLEELGNLKSEVSYYIEENKSVNGLKILPEKKEELYFAGRYANRATYGYGSIYERRKSRKCHV